MTVHAGGRAPAEDRETLGKFLSPASFWSVDRVDASAWVEHGPFAFWLVEALAPAVIVELVTYSGFSFLAFCQAVERLNLNSRCFAVDTWKGDVHSGLYGDDVFARLQQYHDQRYAAFSKLVRSTFDEAAPHFTDSSIDLLHIDGRHFYDDVRHDFETWLPKLSDRAVVLFHDTNVHERGFGVFRLWEELRQRYPHFEFIHGFGLGVIGVGGRVPPRIQMLFDTSNSPDALNLVRGIYARLGQ